MRTTYLDATVRLYHLDSGPDGGAASTLFYGTLTEAMDMAPGNPKRCRTACSSPPTMTWWPMSI